MRKVKTHWEVLTCDGCGFIVDEEDLDDGGICTDCRDDEEDRRQKLSDYRSGVPLIYKRR